MANISNITLPDNTNHGIRAGAIPYGEVDATSTATAFTATVPGIMELTDGTTVMLRNGQITSASGFTLNINGLGAKPCYNNMATGNDRADPPTAATRDTTIFNVAYTMLFVYSTTVTDGGGWICYRGYNSDTNTVGYLLRNNNGALTVTDTARYYKLYFTSADNTQWVPASVNSTNNATAKRDVNQRPINPFGRIVYTSANTNYTAGSTLAVGTAWSQYALVLGYSFNRTGAALTLTSKKPVYVKCAPQSDGSAIMDATTPYVQDLPTTDDGKIYIYLGIAYDATHIELYEEHPVYYHKNGAIRLWNNAESAAQSNWYGTCSTSGASATKAVTCSGYTLVEGNTIAVQFSTMNASTVGECSLNVNSTGAKVIYYDGAPTSSTNHIGWVDDETLFFLYDGTYYRFLGSDKDRYVNCSSGGSYNKLYVLGIDNSGFTSNLYYKPDLYYEGGLHSTASAVNQTLSDTITSSIVQSGDSFNVQIDGTNQDIHQSLSVSIENGLEFEGHTFSLDATEDDGDTGAWFWASSGSQVMEMESYGEETYSKIGVSPSGAYVQNLMSPVEDTDAATKKYVDDSIPSATQSATTGISIAAHGTGTITGVQSTTTTASKVTLGTAFSVPNVTSAGSASTWTFEEKSIPNVTSAGSASTWTFEEKSIPNVTSAGSASTWTFEEKTIPNVTAAGSGSYTQGSFSGGSLTMTMDATDTKKLNITFTAATHGADSHTHIAPTIGTAIKVQSKSGGANGTAPTLGTAIKVQSKSGGANGSAPTLGTAIKVQSKSGGGNGSAPTLGTAFSIPNVTGATDVTVPIKNTSASTFVTGTTHTITDNGHTHSI